VSDKISLPRILEAAEKATPGPWLDMSNINEGIHGDVVRCDKGLDSDMAEICRNPEGDDRPNDMAYIALVDPSTIRAMVLARKTDIPHALLFTGSSGCGKTTMGRIVANHLGCADIDFREIDAGGERGIDAVREIRIQARLRPIGGPVRVWLLDEAHSYLGPAQNALLKILEDTPPHVYFILCTFSTSVIPP